MLDCFDSGEGEIADCLIMGPTNIERCCHVVIVVTWAALQQTQIGSHCIRIVQLMKLLSLIF